MADITEWLKSLGLESHAEAFHDNDFDLDVLPELSEGDPEMLGLSLGHRKRLLKAVATLSGQAEASPETWAVTADRADPSSQQSREGERRQVTVLFAIGMPALD